VKREAVMMKFTMYIVIIGLVSFAFSYAIGPLLGALKYGTYTYMGHVLLNLVVLGIIAGIALYTGSLADKSTDRTTPVEARNLGRIYTGVGILLFIFLIQVFGIHRAIPGVPDPGNYNSEWSIFYVIILLIGLVFVVKGLYGVREKLSYYKLWRSGIWILLLAPLTGMIDAFSPVALEVGAILNYQRYFAYSVSSLFMIIAILSFMLKNHLTLRYKELEDETSRGEDLFKAGRYRAAMEHFDNAIDIGHDLFSQYFYDPDAPRIQVRLPAQYGIPWLRKGDVLLQMNRPRKAIAIYDVILELDPKNEVVWNRKGEILLAMGKYDDANRCFDQALSAVPTYAKAIQNKQKAKILAEEATEEAILIKE
jgi:tetratricopeptide (TPR) repeat protein